MRRSHHPSAHVQRRHDDAPGTEPLDREDRADDVDDGVEGPDLVQVHALDGHLVDGSFGLGEPLEELPRAHAARRRERRVLDQPEDLGQAAVGMLVRVRMRVLMGV
jgi:hypothetical protein